MYVYGITLLATLIYDYSSWEPSVLVISVLLYLQNTIWKQIMDLEAQINYFGTNLTIMYFISQYQNKQFQFSFWLGFPLRHIRLVSF